MINLPGLGLAKGMALTLRRFFEPKATIRYPEVKADVPHKFRGRQKKESTAANDSSIDKKAGSGEQPSQKRQPITRQVDGGHLPRTHRR